MKSWGLVILGTLILGGVLQAEDSRIPIHPISGSIAPYVDKDGYVNPIVPLGDIDFGDRLTLPLVLNYSSAIRTPSPEFGQGWECPLFESKIFDVKKNLKKVELLGGKEIDLIYNQRTDSWKHFFTDDWTGTAKGDDFELVYTTGCKFSFNKGLISSMTTPDGRTIYWNRTGDKLVSIGETGKTPALKIEYDGLGFTKQILLNPDKLGASKFAYTFEPDLISAGIGKIVCPNGQPISFTRTRDKALNPILTITRPHQAPLALCWNLETGRIIDDGAFTYQIVDVDKDKGWPKMNRISKTTKKAETFYFDEKHGTTDITMADGTHRHIEMVQAPGANYKRIRLVEDTKNGKTHLVLRRAFDDQGHLLQEAIGMSGDQQMVRQYAYDNAGRVVSYFFNGKEMWRNVFDPSTGQLKEREILSLGVKMAFEQLPGGQVKESLQKPRAGEPTTTILDANAWQAMKDSAQRAD